MKKAGVQPVYSAMDCKYEFGLFFRKLRYKEGLGFRDFAKSIRIKEDKLDKIERGVIFPDIKLIIKLILEKRTNEKEIFSFLKYYYPSEKIDYEFLYELKNASPEAKEKFMNSFNNENFRIAARNIGALVRKDENLVEELDLNPNSHWEIDPDECTLEWLEEEGYWEW